MKPSEFKISISVKGYDNKKTVENYRNGHAAENCINLPTAEKASTVEWS